MNPPTSFVVIDDDSTSNLLCTIIIEEVAPGLQVNAFQVAEKGLDYITRAYPGKVNPTILFLDINMPTCTGWEFLEEFEKLDHIIKSQFKIYMFSSSLDPGDQQRALENKNVAGYLEKPLTEKLVLSLLASQEERN